METPGEPVNTGDKRMGGTEGLEFRLPQQVTFFSLEKADGPLCPLEIQRVGDGVELGMDSFPVSLWAGDSGG